MLEATRRAENGSVDADLGGGVIKQRISRPNEGKSGGFRSIVLFRSGDKAFFVYGFPKNRRDNIRRGEEQGFRLLAEEMLGYGDTEIERALESGALKEVRDDDEDLS